jgi:hypothetical protein
MQTPSGFDARTPSQKHGADQLRAVAMRGGPAAHIARSMLKGETVPYR